MTIGSILPKAFEPIRTQFRVAHRVRDVLVPEVLLDRPRVLALTGELKPAGMAQHVRMDREGELGELAGARNQLPGRRRRHGSFALGHKHIRQIWVDAAEFAQRAQLDAADRVCRGHAIFQSIDVHRSRLEIDLIPAQSHQLGDSQPMPVREKDERPIAHPVATHLARGLQQLLDLRRGQVFAGAPIKIGGSARGDRRGGGRSRSRLNGLPIASPAGNIPI